VERRTGWSIFTALVIGALVLGAIAIGNGQLELFLFLIFPMMRADGAWGIAAILMALAAFVMLVVNLRTEFVLDGDEKRTSGGGVLLIGPIPIVFGTDRRTTILVLLVAVVVLAALVFLLLL
jgi:uncharacterized protein (TIGR00304 family)